MEKSYTTQQTAEIMGVSVQSIRLWIKKGVVQAFKVRGRWHINESELKRLRGEE